MRLSLALVGILAVPSLVACTAAADPVPDPTTGSPGSATAVVEVERTTGPGDSTRNDAVAARVVRVKQGAVDDSALSIAGVTADVPLAGTCAVPTDAAGSLQGRSVELLDIGQVTLTSDSVKSDAPKSLVLLPRTMPDPAGVVSGVFYSSRSADAFVPGSRVALKAGGGADLLEGFNINVSAPKELVDVQVRTGADGLDVLWDASDADARDLVYADVLSPGPRVALRCTAIDAGHLLVPSDATEGQLAVHRLHKESFRAKGIEPGEIRFDVAKVINFRR